MTDSLLGAAEQRLREFDVALDVERPTYSESVAADRVGNDVIVTLSRGNAKAQYAVVAKSSMTLAVLAQKAPSSPYRLLVIGSYIGRRSAAALRKAEIQFIDAAGNAFLKFGDVLIEVQGRPDSRDRAHASSAPGARLPRPANILSPRRSQVIFALLTWRELRTATVRDLAHAAGVSVGQAHDALAQLERAEFFLPSSGRLERTDSLLEYWAAAYPTGLGRKLEVARYRGAPEKPIRKPDSSPPIFLSGESAEGTDIARPATLTLYVEALQSRLPIENRWNANPDETPNIFVRRKFWKSPRAGEEESTKTPSNAPWPLVYADLLSAGDARLREAAQTWRIRCVGSDEL